MIFSKRCLYSLTLIFLTFSLMHSAELGEAQTKKYINHLIDTLFIPKSHSLAHQNTLTNFSHELNTNVVNNFGRYQHFYSLSKVYNDNEVYHEVLNKSIDLIKKSTRNAAILALQGSVLTGHQDLIVTKIVASIMKEVTSKVNKSTVLQAGVFAGYFGQSLDTKIRTLITKEITKQDQRIARVKCQTCSMKFDANDHQKIELTCKHTICLTCLKELWTVAGSQMACHKCGTRITVSEHMQNQWFTPAVDYYYDSYGYTEPYVETTAPTYTEGYTDVYTY